MDTDVHLEREDVLSAWCGIRPLVKDPSKPNTESLARTHIVHASPSKLISVAGGKWTTFRAMAEDTVNEAISLVQVNSFFFFFFFFHSGPKEGKKIFTHYIQSKINYHSSNQKDHLQLKIHSSLVLILIQELYSFILLKNIKSIKLFVFYLMIFFLCG